MTYPLSKRNAPANLPQLIDRRGGLVVVLVLWVLVTVTVLTVSLVQNTRLENAIRVAAGDHVTSRWLARAGIYQAIGVVANDLNETDSQDDLWYDNEPLFRDQTLANGGFIVYADRGGRNERYAYGVVDEAGKLNLNTASLEAIGSLPNVTVEMAEAIVRWRRGQETNTESTMREDPPVQSPDNSIVAIGERQTIRELMLATGMTRELFYGEDVNFNGILDQNENDGGASPPEDNQDGILDRGLISLVTVYSYERNQDGQGRRRLNISRADGNVLIAELGLTTGQAQWIIAHRGIGFESITDILFGSAGTKVVDPEADEIEEISLADFRRIADRITITDRQRIEGRVNINTAGVNILRTLPGVTERMALHIEEYRQNLSGGFASIAELLTLPQITVLHFQQLAPLITVRSNVFTLRSRGRASRTGAIHFVEAVVDRGGSEPSVIYWKESQ